MIKIIKWIKRKFTKKKKKKNKVKLKISFCFKVN